MEHQVIEFFPSICGVYTYPEEKINDIKLVCQKIRDTIQPGDENYNQNGLNGDLFHYYNDSNTNIYDFHPELEDHRKWVLECATHFFTKVHNYVLSDENELLMTDAWMNYCLERAQQSEHNHHNSLISGTYYVNLIDWVHAPLTFMKREQSAIPTLLTQKTGTPLINIVGMLKTLDLKREIFYFGSLIYYMVIMVISTCGQIEHLSP